MANLTVTQANDIATVIHYLGRLGMPADPAQAKHFADAVLRLRTAMEAKLLAGPMEGETLAAIAAVEAARAVPRPDASRGRPRSSPARPNSPTS